MPQWSSELSTLDARPNLIQGQLNFAVNSHAVQDSLTVLELSMQRRTIEPCYRFQGSSGDTRQGFLNLLLVSMQFRTTELSHVFRFSSVLPDCTVRYSAVQDYGTLRTLIYFSIQFRTSENCY